MSWKKKFEEAKKKRYPMQEKRSRKMNEANQNTMYSFMADVFDIPWGDFDYILEKYEKASTYMDRDYQDFADFMSEYGFERVDTNLIIYWLQVNAVSKIISELMDEEEVQEIMELEDLDEGDLRDGFEMYQNSIDSHISWTSDDVIPQELVEEYIDEYWY